MRKKILTFILACAIALTGSLPASPVNVLASEVSTESAASNAKAAENSVGLGVAYHTVDEIVAYLKDQNATLNDSVTYETTPSYTEPYLAGSLSEETKNSAIAMLNNVRYIAGLSANVTWSNSYEEETQAAALVSAANKGISHTPSQPDGMDASLYDLGCSGCFSSNLAAGYSNLNRAIIEGWMKDSESSNISRVGHRRWILNPTMGRTAFGAVTNTSTGYKNYYSMYCFDYSNPSASETKVAWPAQVMPLEYFGSAYPWSLSIGSTVDASAITVSLVRRSDNATWTFSSSSADGDFYVDNGNYGQTGCIIFRPDSIAYEDGDIFDVTVTGLEETISYTVTFFDLDNYWHVHDYTYSFTYSWASDDQTCTITYTCQCGDQISKTYDATCTTIEPTCTENGSKIYTFTDDYGGTFTRTITLPSTGHVQGTAIKENITPATCTKDGSYDSVVYCSKCGAELSRETFTIPATGHTYDDGVVTKDATYTENGIIIYTCITCGDTYTKEIPYVEGLSEEDGVLVYYKDGAKSSYTGTATYHGVNYYVSDGVVDTAFSGLVQIGDKWYSIKNGIIEEIYTTKPASATNSGTSNGSSSVSSPTQSTVPSVKNTKIKKIVSKKKKTVKLTWKKVSGASGYEIQYSRKASMKKSKTKIIKKGSKTSAKLKKLKSGKKYYVRIRAYKIINGKKIYSDYSKKRKIVVK